MNPTGVERQQPYPGPAAFLEKQKPFFCGRRRETAELCDLLLAHRIGILYAGSGAGKTSLVNAGIKPRLEERGATVRLLRVSVHPKDSPPNSAKNVFAANAVWSAAPKLAWRPGARLMDLIEERQEEFPKPQVLIFDQFEELFTTFPTRWKDRSDLFSQIAEILQTRSVRVLCCLREESLAVIGGYEGLLPDGFRVRYHLERLRAAQALEAIESPAKEVGCPFDEGVAEELRNDLLRERVQTESGLDPIVGEFVEPLQLQVVCARIWQTLPNDAKTITAKHVKEFGGP